VKTEPGQYSYSDLARDGRTTWEGVSNPLALIHLRAMRRGDRVLVYHSGGESQVVGLARVSKGAYPDPALSDPRRVVVDLVPVAAARAPVPMSSIRAEPSCADLALVRIPRLSVMPVPAPAYAAIARLGGLPA
jgi:predicted RNA-binding protein with PUA-like domain